MMRHVPNMLTGLRILLTPAFVAAFACGKLPLALGLFLIGELTDMLDGFIARRFNCITKVGKALDPLADKLTLIGVVSCLYIAQRIPGWLMAIIVGREVFMILGGIVLWKRKVEFAADKFGKVTTVLFFAATLLLFPWHGNATLLLLGDGLLLASIVSSLTACGHYIKLFWPKFQATKKK